MSHTGQHSVAFTFPCPILPIGVWDRSDEGSTELRWFRGEASPSGDTTPRANGTSGPTRLWLWALSKQLSS